MNSCIGYAEAAGFPLGQPTGEEAIEIAVELEDKRARRTVKLYPLEAEEIVQALENAGYMYRVGDLYQLECTQVGITARGPVATYAWRYCDENSGRWETATVYVSLRSGKLVAEF